MNQERGRAVMAQPRARQKEAASEALKTRAAVDCRCLMGHKAHFMQAARARVCQEHCLLVLACWPLAVLEQQGTGTHQRPLQSSSGSASALPGERVLLWRGRRCHCASKLARHPQCAAARHHCGPQCPLFPLWHCSPYSHSSSARSCFPAHHYLKKVF